MNDEGASPDISPRTQIVIFGAFTAMIILGGAIFLWLSGGDSAPQAAVVTDEGSEQTIVNTAPVAAVADDGDQGTIAESASVTTAADASTTIVDEDSEVLVDEELAEPVAVDGDQGTIAAGASTTIVDGDEPSPTSELSYATMPDGSPVPVIALFDVETIVLSGVVPSEDARSRLETLAVANSKFPNITTVNLVTVNPDVPISVGVRVIELNSVRFPDGSDDISNEHATELDRVGAIMNALPNTSVLVIGHADQRGSADANYKISEQRAQAVVSYLAGQGLSPARLSSRAVGSDDLYTLNNDAAALALNRRTEFVFYGLLVG